MTEDKIYQYELNGEVYQVSLKLATYTSNQQAAAYLVDEKTGGLFDYLSTNGKIRVPGTLPMRSDEPEKIHWAIQNGIIADECILTVPSGYIYLYYMRMTSEIHQRYLDECPEHLKS